MNSFQYMVCIDIENLNRTNIVKIQRTEILITTLNLIFDDIFLRSSFDLISSSVSSYPEIQYELYTQVEPLADPACGIREETMERKLCFVAVINTLE
jgi:hypothetical protein